MTAIIRHQVLTAGLIAAALCAAQPAAADTIELDSLLARNGSAQSFYANALHGFRFVSDSVDTSQPAATAGSSQAAIDLGRLFTKYGTHADPTSSNATNDSNFQLAVWKTLNDRAGANSDASNYGGNFWTVQQNIRYKNWGRWRRDRWDDHDVEVFAPIPEPQTYAMLLAGLAIIGFTLRRRKEF